MSISKRERASILAIAAIILVSVVIHLGFTIYQNAQSQRNAQERESANQAYGMGETLVLDSTQDELQLEDGTDYTASFGWQGTMEVTVSQSRLYRSKEQLENAEGYSVASLDAPQEESAYVVCRMHVSNHDATPNPGFVNEDERPAFMMSAFNIGPAGELVGLVDLSNRASTSGEYAFFTELPTGTEHDYALVFEVGNDIDPSSLYMGVGMAHPEKYRINLNTEDRRGDVS